MDDKVYYPETIQDTPFPESEVVTQTNTTSESGDVVTPNATKEEGFPRKIIARETISSALNTRSRKILAEFEFTEMGAIQIGKYQNGVSGDLRIAPSGIVARNLAGETTFAIDVDTGDAIFKGTITAGSIVTGQVYVGDSGGNVLIDGANQRIVISDGEFPRIIIGYQKDGF